MKIAVDFDGTIVEHRYPAIGEELLFAIETLRELQRQQHLIILWTYRAGKELEDAVQYCRQRGLEFYAVNKNYPEEVFDETISRKISADIYIDDHNFDGFPGWSIIYQKLTNGKDYEIYDDIPEKYQKRSFAAKFKKLFSNRK
jgi:hydroxymethylpyrimidine pyrophosphatase-like HAD family hydrolase